MILNELFVVEIKLGNYILIIEGVKVIDKRN